MRHKPLGSVLIAGLVFAVLFGLVLGGVSQAAKLKVGVLRLTSTAPIFIGQERGLFKDEGLDVELVFFKSAQPVALAMAAGDVDVGATGLTAGLYNALAGGLKAKIVADKGRVWPGYKLVGLMVSNKAWSNGLTSLAMLKGKKVGVTQIGSTFHYMLGNILAKNGMSLDDVKITPLGGVKNMMDVVAADRIDAAFMVQPFCTSMEANGQGRIMFWASEHITYQIAGIFMSQKVMADRAVALAFMKGYIKSCRVYHDNCLERNGDQEVRGPDFDQIIDYIAKYTSRKPSMIAAGLNYNQRDGQLLNGDVQRQINWYYAHKLLTKKLDAGRVVDHTLWREALQALGD